MLSDQLGVYKQVKYEQVLDQGAWWEACVRTVFEGIIILVTTYSTLSFQGSTNTACSGTATSVTGEASTTTDASGLPVSYGDYQYVTDTDLPGSSSSFGGHQQTSECQSISNIEVLLLNHSAKVLDQSSEYILSIDRSTKEHFWLAMTSFYKGAISKPQKLRRPLVVNFVNTGEIGSDAGALRKEFFEDAIREVNDRLFEGEDSRRVPKKDVSLELLFEV